MDFLLRNFLASSSHVVSVVNKLFHNRSRQQLLKQRPTCCYYIKSELKNK